MTYKYVSKADILEWVNIQRPRLAVDDIPDLIMSQGHARVDGFLFRKGIMTAPGGNDTNSFLKLAAGCFILSLLCKAKVIATTQGELLREEFRDIQIQYQRTNPLFFFATGASKPFMDLLPYETIRMYAFDYLRAYLRWRFHKRTGKAFPHMKIKFDKSSRGAYWNEDTDYSDVDDALYGDVFDEEWDYDV